MYKTRGGYKARGDSANSQSDKRATASSVEARQGDVQDEGRLQGKGRFKLQVRATTEELRQEGDSEHNGIEQ